MRSKRAFAYSRSTGYFCLGCSGSSLRRRAKTWRIDSAGRGPVQSDLAYEDQAHFTFRADIWDTAGNSMVEHLAGLDSHGIAVAGYEDAVTARPADKITLRHNADERPDALAWAPHEAWRTDARSI